MYASEEDVFQNEQGGENVKDGVKFLALAAEHADEHIGDDAEGDAFGDAVEQRHGYDAEVGGDSRVEVIVRQLQLGHVAEHEEAHDDERGGRSKGRHGGEHGREQRGDEEEEGCCHSREAGTSAHSHAGGGFHEGRRGGSAEHGAGGRCYGVGEQGGAYLGQAALFVEHLGLGTDADERAKGIEEVDEEE